jgi:hypothetical protein
MLLTCAWYAVPAQHAGWRQGKNSGMSPASSLQLCSGLLLWRAVYGSGSLKGLNLKVLVLAQV